MSSDKPTQTNTVHDVLGPGIAIYDDHSRTRLRLLGWFVGVALGVFGVWIGLIDASGNTLFGLAEVAGGVVLFVYAIGSIVLEAKRLSSPIRLVIARDGYELLPGTRTVSWSEVESIGDPKYPAGQAKFLRVQLADPEEFADEYAFTPFDRLKLKWDKGDLVLGGGFAIPLRRAEKLMQDALDEYRGTKSGRPQVPAGRHEAKSRRGRRRSG